MNCRQRIYDIKAEIKLDNNYIASGDSLKIDFLFYLGINERISFNGFVLIKFYNSEGEVELMDIHRPSYKMIDWVPGSMIKYYKCIEIPENISSGEYKISLSLINPGKNFEKIRIKNESFRDGEHYMGKINIINMLSYKGFYSTERSIIECQDYTFKWASKEAIAYLNNPKKDIILSLKLSAPPNFFSGEYQKTKILLNKKLIDTIVFNQARVYSKEYNIKSTMLGNEKYFELKFISDKEFIPKKLGLNEDSRNLSLLIYSIAFK